MKLTNLFNNMVLHFLKLFTFLVFPILITACSSLLPTSEPLESADDFKQGPGFFSGAKGGFYALRDDKKQQEFVDQQNSSVTSYQKPVANMNLNETSKMLDDKIKQLEKDQIELELLKRAVDKKIQAQ